MARFFNDIRAGDQTLLPAVQITRAMRDRHVELYGEDWQGEILERMQLEGICPAPMVLSIIAGQMGASGFIHIEFLKSFEVECRNPVRVGDVITTLVTVEAKVPHRDPSKDFGYITVRQRVRNQQGILCFERVPTYTVPLRLGACGSIELNAG